MLWLLLQACTTPCDGVLDESERCLPERCGVQEFAQQAGDADVYVKAGASGDGSRTDPLGQLHEAVAALPNGGVIALAEGRYEESLLIQTGSLDIVGRCPELVEIHGHNAEAVNGHFDGRSRLSGVTLSGGDPTTLLLTQGELVVRDAVLSQYAVQAIRVTGATTRLDLAGVHVFASDGVSANGQVRVDGQGTLVAGEGTRIVGARGWAVRVEHDSHLESLGLRISKGGTDEDGVGLAVGVVGGALTGDSLAVDGQLGHAMFVADGLVDLDAVDFLDTTAAPGNHSAGVEAVGSDTRVTLRSGRIQEVEGLAVVALEEATVTLGQPAQEGDGLVIRDLRPVASEGAPFYGRSRAVHAQEKAEAHLIEVTIEGFVGDGVALSGEAQGSLTDSTVRDLRCTTESSYGVLLSGEAGLSVHNSSVGEITGYAIGGAEQATLTVDHSQIGPVQTGCDGRFAAALHFEGAELNVVGGSVTGGATTGLRVQTAAGASATIVDLDGLHVFESELVGVELLDRVTGEVTGLHIENTTPNAAAIWPGHTPGGDGGGDLTATEQPGHGALEGIGLRLCGPETLSLTDIEIVGSTSAGALICGQAADITFAGLRIDGVQSVTDQGDAFGVALIDGSSAEITGLEIAEVDGTHLGVFDAATLSADDVELLGNQELDSRGIWVQEHAQLSGSNWDLTTHTVGIAAHSSALIDAEHVSVLRTRAAPDTFLASAVAAAVDSVITLSEAEITEVAGPALMTLDGSVLQCTDCTLRDTAFAAAFNRASTLTLYQVLIDGVTPLQGLGGLGVYASARSQPMRLAAVDLDVQDVVVAGLWALGDAHSVVDLHGGSLEGADGAVLQGVHRATLTQVALGSSERAGVLLNDAEAVLDMADWGDAPTQLYAQRCDWVRDPVIQGELPERAQVCPGQSLVLHDYEAVSAYLSLAPAIQGQE